MNNVSKTKLSLGLGLAVLLLQSPLAGADIAAAAKMQEESGVLADYRRLLPLEGGSNFRDMGGYRTQDGKRVRRGLLFRSGVMTWLSEADQDYLAQLGVESIVDLRSEEELALFPNRWAAKADIDYFAHDYSIEELLGSADAREVLRGEPGASYRIMPYMITPQLKTYFSLLSEGGAPIVVNCSAGQDRTGIASALLLTALGVPRETVIEDYLLSTDFRRPQVERGTIDLASHAENNAFAALMLNYSSGEETHARPLFTPEGRPYIEIAFEQIERDFGTVEAFLDSELGIDAADIARLKAFYLE